MSIHLNDKLTPLAERSTHSGFVFLAQCVNMHT